MAVINENGRIVKMTKEQRKQLLADELGLEPKRVKLPRRKEPAITLTTQQVLIKMFKSEKKNFEETLEAVRDIDPRFYLKTMVDIAKLSVVSERQISKDFHQERNDLKELMELAKSKTQHDEATKGLFAYADAVEIKETPQPIKSGISVESVTHPAITEDLRELGMQLPTSPNK